MALMETFITSKRVSFTRKMRRLTRHQRTAPTSSKPPYLIFNPHTVPPLVADPSGELHGIFIDPGIKNCAIRSSSLDRKTRAIRTNFQILINFCYTPPPLGGDGGGGDASVSTCGGARVDSESQYYQQSLLYLEPYREWFQRSHYIVIESQLPVNYDLVRMGQHIITYLMVTVRDAGFRPLIIEIDSRLKSRLLGAPPRLTKPQLKKWCRDKALSLLKERGDLETVTMISKQPKKDDHGDVVCYDEVWWNHLLSSH